MNTFLCKKQTQKCQVKRVPIFGEEFAMKLDETCQVFKKDKKKMDSGGTLNNLAKKNLKRIQIKKQD